MLKLLKKDRLLLHELMKNARQSISQIARNIGVSKEVCQYRLKKLEQEKLILGYYPIIDLSGVGYHSLRLQIKFNTHDKEKLQEIIAFLEKHSIVSWIYLLSGSWDIVVLFWVKELKEYEQFYELFIDQFGMLIQDKLLTIASKIHHFQRNAVTGIKDRTVAITGQGKKTQLDKLDFAILKAFLVSARTPLHTIALQENVAINTVKYRLKTMERFGIIKGYRPNLDVTIVDLDYFKVQMKLLNPHQKKAVLELISQNTHTIYITESIGPFDVEFEADYHQISDLIHFIDKLRETIQIKSYDVIFENKVLKLNDVPT